ncbi:MAG: hypothetical protein GX352_07575 [Clostridiales bacterium]|nr:hypothetical protein [Clostridiales bacterium]
MEAGTKARKNIWGTIFLVFILLALIAAISVAAVYIYQILNIETFYEGVFVDGIPLADMTKEEGLSKIWEHNQPDLDKMQIVLTHEDQRWEYDYKDINGQINVEEVIDMAYLVGREGTVVERLKEIYNLTKEEKRFETILTYDVSLLQDEIESIAHEINEDYIDATIEFHPDQKDKFSFTPDKAGKGMLTSETMEELIARVDAGDFSDYEIPIEVLEPTYTLEELKTWTSRIGYYSTPLKDSTANRVHNIKLSSKAYYNLRLEPGDVFSLNDATGPRDLKHGYRMASVIKDGNRYEDEAGGGNCQTSTTLYGAVVRADLEIVERYPHSIPSSYTPIGTDATVNYPYADFKFKNNMDTPIFITRYFAGNSLHVEVYGKQSEEFDEVKLISWEISRTDTPEYKTVDDPDMYEGETKTEIVSRPGIKAVSYRVYYKDGQEINRVKEDDSSYRRNVGLKRVGTKKKPGDAESDKPEESEKPKKEEPKEEEPKEGD